MTSLIIKIGSKETGEAIMIGVVCMFLLEVRMLFQLRSGKISMEEMIEKLLKGVEATNLGVTTMKSEFSTLSQLVSSHSTSIKQLE